MAKPKRNKLNNDENIKDEEGRLTIDIRAEMMDLPPEVSGLDTPKKEMLVVLCHLWPNIAAACRTAGISRATFYNWKEAEPVFAAAVEQLHEARLDNIESRVHDIAMSNHQGSLTACIFLLNTQRSDRFQYSRKVDHNVRIEAADPVDMSSYAIDITGESKRIS